MRQATPADTGKLAAQYEKMTQGLNATPCSGGQVEGLSCSNVELLSHLPLGALSATPAAATDIRGFVDLNSNREYALVACNIGAAVSDVTDPANPREIGFVDGQNTVWRDVKVHRPWNAADARGDAGDGRPPGHLLLR